jgi:hypothetical protein
MKARRASLLTNLRCSYAALVRVNPMAAACFSRIFFRRASVWGVRVFHVKAKRASLNTHQRRITVCNFHDFNAFQRLRAFSRHTL